MGFHWDLVNEIARLIYPSSETDRTVRRLGGSPRSFIINRLLRSSQCKFGSNVWQKRRTQHA